jgi:ubiquitin
MEKIYEKSCGKKYSKQEVVGEEEVEESFDSVVNKIEKSGK